MVQFDELGQEFKMTRILNLIMTKPLICCVVALAVALAVSPASAQALTPLFGGSLRAALDAISGSIAEHPAAMIPP